MEKVVNCIKLEKKREIETEKNDRNTENKKENTVPMRKKWKDTVYLI